MVLAITQSNIFTVVNAYISPTTRAVTEANYGSITTWDTSGVNNMANLFYNKNTFNSDISGWNVSNVTNMSTMFQGASIFNYDISRWDTGNVTNMMSMFQSATNFNGNISLWNTSSVTNMEKMFYLAANFNSDISLWNISNVVNTRLMFSRAYKFNKSLTNWDTRNVNNMEYMFNYTTDFNQDLSWNTTNVTNMAYMISANNFNGNISNWNTANVTNMNSMFEAATYFNQSISSWNTAKVTSMNKMFNGAVSFNQDLSSWNTSKVTNMANMFSGAGTFNKYIGDWDVGFVTNMTSMFHGATVFNQNISNWNVFKVTNMTSMFCEDRLFDQDIRNWNVSNVTNMTSVFQGATAFNQNISNWNVSKVTNMQNMFDGAFAFNQDLNYNSVTKTWDVSGVTIMSCMFQNATSFNGNISLWNTKSVGYMNSMFSGATTFDRDINGWNVSNVTNMTSTFQGATAFNQNISNWNVSKVTTMKNMFYGASAFNQDINYNSVTNAWNVSGVTIMSCMFQNATSFNGNISLWNTKSVGYMDSMFSGATTFNRDISNWKVNKLISTMHMFYGATAFNQDFNYNSVTNAWDVSGVTHMSNMFQNATSFNGNISLWNTKSVGYMDSMFYNATAFRQDLNNWNVSGVTNMTNMFYGASLFNGDITSWNVQNVALSGMGYMLYQSAFTRDLSMWEPVKLTGAIFFSDSLNSLYYPNWGKYRLNVIGLRFLTIFKNTTYTDRGVSDIYTPMVTTNSVNSAVVGTYSVAYSVTAAVTGRSYPSYAIRYVTVIAFPVITFPATTTRIVRGNLVTINTSLASISCQYSVNSGTDWTAILVTSGTSTTFLLADSTYEVNAIQVKCTDLNGNENITTNSSRIIINMVGPVDLAVTFPSSTTPANRDLPPNISITNLPTDAVAWSFSVDGSLNWTSKTISALSFTLPEKLTSYASNSIRVRCEDEIGNYSDVTITNPTPITIDLTGPYGLTVSFPSSTSLTYKEKNVSINIIPDDAVSWSYTVDSGDNWSIMANSTLFFTLADKTYIANAIQVKCMDQAGNYCAAEANSDTIIIDFTGPYGLAVIFPSSTSLSYKIKTVNITNLPTEAVSWSYSIDSGNNWTFMSRSSLSFTLADNSYISDTIQVKCVDAVGNSSAIKSNDETILIDLTSPVECGVSFPFSTSVSYKNKLVTITNLPSDAISWQYTVNSGNTWTTRSTFSSVLTFSLLDGTYATNSIQVSCADPAGNNSEIVTNPAEIIIYETIYGMTVGFPSSTTPETVLQTGAGTVFITTLPANVTSYKFSLDYGNSWKTVARGSGFGSFLLLESSYAESAIQVVCMDAVGNSSDPVTNSFAINIDYRSPFTPTIPSSLNVSNEPVTISALSTLDLTDISIIGATVAEQKTFTSLLVRSLFSENTAQNQLVLTQGSILPGFSTAISKDLYLYSASSNVLNSQKTTLIRNDLIGKDFYVLLESGDSITLQTIHEIVYISKTCNIFKIQSTAGTTFASIGDTYSYDGLNITLGSIIGTLIAPKINFILSAMNCQIDLSNSALIPQYTSTELTTDATINLNTSVSAEILQNTFFFRTDQLITEDEAFVYYYVDTTKWVEAQTILNPKNGIVIEGKYAPNDGVGKDFLRDLARQLFGTYLGSDLFTNEDSVVADINENCDAIALRIFTLLDNIDIQNGILGANMQNDDFGNKYFKNDNLSTSNISRALLDQITKTAPSRLADIKSNYKYNEYEDGFFRLPILSGDTISYKLTISPSATQENAVPTGRTNLIPRTYTVILNVI